MRRLLLVFALLLPLASFAEELAVAAAADLNFAMKEIAQQYQRDTGNTLKLSFGSSGNFLVQIENGAPFDLFFSADVSYPQKLEQGGLAEPGTLYRYAVGKIVLWAPNSSKLNLKQGINVLLDPSIHKIAIANPAHAPYGRAAEEALKQAGIYDRVKDKLVLGENISQTAQFVQSGNADIGVLALSLAVAPAMQKSGRYVEIPSSDYPPIIQAVVILKSAKNKDTATQFLNFLKEGNTVALMRRYGFLLPSEVANTPPRSGSSN